MVPDEQVGGNWCSRWPPQEKLQRLTGPSTKSHQKEGCSKPPLLRTYGKLFLVLRTCFLPKGIGTKDFC